MAQDDDFEDRIRGLLDEYNAQVTEPRWSLLTAFREAQGVIVPVLERLERVWPGALLEQQQDKVSIYLSAPAAETGPEAHGEMKISADLEREKVLCVADVAGQQTELAEWEASEITDDAVQLVAERFVRMVLHLGARGSQRFTP